MSAEAIDAFIDGPTVLDLGCVAKMMQLQGTELALRNIVVDLPVIRRVSLRCIGLSCMRKVIHTPAGDVPEAGRPSEFFESPRPQRKTSLSSALVKNEFAKLFTGYAQAVKSISLINFT
jgi:hypothetical protein